MYQIRSWILMVFWISFFNVSLSLQAKEYVPLCSLADTSGFMCVIDYELPEFLGGDIKMWVKNHLIYPQEAFDAHIEGKVYVGFTIGTDSLVHDVKVFKSSDTLLNKAALEVVQKMPRWKPATQRGVPVKISYTLPITFTCDEALFMVVDEMPVFPEPLFEWVSDKVRTYIDIYSSVDKSYVTFVIEKDGRVTSPEIVRSSGFRDIDEKALELVRSMPPWKPGKQNGKVVRVLFTLPVGLFI